MKVEALLFGGVAVFFGAAATLYGVWSRADPTGTTALVVAFGMVIVTYSGSLWFNGLHAYSGL